MITNDVKYVGVNDHRIDMFEGQYAVPNGMSYNSYLILDEKIAVVDSVEAHFGEEWLERIDAELNGNAPSYLIVQHMEPDHSANITAFMEKYADAIVVSSDKAFVMMQQFYHNAYESRRMVVKDGDTLSLGRHQLTFVAAPMVHWPEVMFTYDQTEHILFSADAFGKFGALDHEEPWEHEARRYYIGIVGKYGPQVQKVLEKAAALPIDVICPLHGPVLSKDIPFYLNLYQTWSSYAAQDSGVVIAYTSVYGNTKKAVMHLADRLTELGVSVVVHDLARCDMALAISDAFRYDRLVLATTTYNADIFPFMREFITGLLERGYKKRRVALIENGSWAPTAAKKMRAMLEECKDLSFTDTTLTIRSALHAETEQQLSVLAKELV